MEDADEFCDDTEEEVVTKPTASGVRSVLEVLQNLCLFSAETGTEMKGLLHRFESLHTRDQIAEKKQYLVFRTTFR